MPSMIVVLVVASLVVFLVLRLLRSRALREKYAALWVIVGVAVVVLVAFPGLLGAAASLLGFAVPSNLLFLLAIVLLLGVSLHLSLEISRLEDETRVLAEESAIARHTSERLALRVEALEARDAGHVVGPGARRAVRPSGAQQMASERPQA